MKRINFATILEILLAVVLPLVGVVVSGQPVGQYTEFPPLTRYVEHAGFSWPMFIGLAVFILVSIVPFLWRVVASSFRTTSSPINLVPVSFFPWWGWFGLLLGCMVWILAWTRFEWFASCQQFTFSPLWFSYILLANALTFRRTGRCMLINRTGYFFRLFPLSAAFWWFFEYLNRFVQNWYYQGVDGLSSFQYFIFATLPFSTVLPAVLGTYELLKSFPRLSCGLEDSMRLNIKHPKVVAMVALLLFGSGLAGIGIWPDYLFPLLWISPLGIITALQTVRGKETIFSPIRNGNWQQIFLLAISALMCGFFWEMWNYYSEAKWLYAVPFVGRFHIFEMPILGFAGYLPFGLECAVVAALVSSNEAAKTRT